MNQVAYSTISERPQVVRDAPMLIARVKSDPAHLARYLPPPLRPHPNGRLLLNMWAISDPRLSSGFGALEPMNVSYLAIEVEGHDGSSVDGRTTWAARYFVRHWLGSGAARRYARAVSGLDTETGATSLSFDGDRIEAVLTLAGRPSVTMRARAVDVQPAVNNGHSNYFAERRAKNGHGRELAHLSIPWVGDILKAEPESLNFDFAPGVIPDGLLPNGDAEVESILYRRLTFVPYLTYRIVEEARAQ